MSDNTKRTYTKRSSRWYEKAGDRRTLLYNQAALASPIGQKMLSLIKQVKAEPCDVFGENQCHLCHRVVDFGGQCDDDCKLQLLLAEIAEIEGAK